MENEDKLWKLHGKYRQHIQNNTLNFDNHSEDFWEFIVLKIQKMLDSNRYLSIRMLFRFEDISDTDLFNMLYVIFMYKAGYKSFLEDTDKYVRSYPPIAALASGGVYEYETYLPNKYRTKILESYDFKAIAAEINQVSDSELNSLFPKSFKRWTFIKKIDDDFIALNKKS